MYIDTFLQHTYKAETDYTTVQYLILSYLADLQCQVVATCCSFMQPVRALCFCVTCLVSIKTCTSYCCHFGIGAINKLWHQKNMIEKLGETNFISPQKGNSNSNSNKATEGADINFWT